MIWIYLLSFCLAVVQNSNGSKDILGSPLTLQERLQIFGQVSSEKLPSYEYTSLEKVNLTGLRSYPKRPPTFLQYRLKIGGQLITLSLKPNTEVLAPDCVVYKYSQNGSKTLHPCRKHSEQCLFTGKSENHNNSWVAANVCNGLEGVISISNTSLFVSPLKTKKVATNNSSGDDLHVIYRYRGDKQVCATNAKSSVQPSLTRRSRRFASRRYIETSVFVDQSMVKFHGDRLEEYVHTVVNVASERYQDESLGENIQLTLKELHILESYDVFNIGISYDARKTLSNFCKWQAEFLKHQAIDISVLITRIDIEYPIGDPQTTGLANPKGACDVHRRCAVVEDTGPNMGLSMAHEIGHLLGMRHDGVGNNCTEGIMSVAGSSGPAAFSWSTCSVQALRAFLSTQSAECLINEPKAISHSGGSVKPGTLYNVEQQCRLLLGKDAVACFDKKKDVCENLSCRTSPEQICRAYGFPLMDGTDCNNTRHWCIEGKSVAMDQSAPGPIDGGWSEWDREFSVCTRTCGGGVKIKRRRCDNPTPQYGGRACSGKSLQATICNLQTCQTDYRTEQCTNKNRHERGYSWGPLNDQIGDFSCLLRCMTTNATTPSIRNWPESYKDGTECIATTKGSFSRCLDGKCMNFGCDGHLDSGYQYDKCGVCNGTGDTCRKTSGSYTQNNVSNLFTSVVVIPKGSTNVMILQTNIYCFLSVAVNGQRIFNKVIQEGSTSFMHKKDLMNYNKMPEHVDIRGPLHDDIEIQVYRRYDYRLYIGVTPNITYSYYTHILTTSPSRYAWFKTNTQCTKECGTGVSVPIVKCGEFNKPVADHYCDIEKKPSEAPEPCNTHLCPPEWRTSNWSACSVICGNGIRNRNVVCAQKDKEDYKTVQDEMCLGKEKPVVISNCSMGPCGEWKAGPWSSCSKTCSEGKKERFVACYREGEDSIIKEEFCPRDQKPANIVYCNHGKCRPDLTGSACTDIVPNCKGTYGYDICVGIYARWAEHNCMKSCGMCSVFCEDDVVCSQYLKSGLNICQNYADWSKLHCPKVCGHCDDCRDTSSIPCNRYDQKYCNDSNYAGWMALHCRKYCQQCVD